eukprot:16957-Heterococcus_DN1.PRE.1
MSSTTRSLRLHLVLSGSSTSSHFKASAYEPTGGTTCMDYCILYGGVIVHDYWCLVTRNDNLPTCWERRPVMPSLNKMNIKQQDEHEESLTVTRSIRVINDIDFTHYM